MKILYAFGYNSAEGEPIWMKSGALSTLLGLALADFGRDPRSSDSLSGAALNFVVFSQVNTA